MKNHNTRWWLAWLIGVTFAIFCFATTVAHGKTIPVCSWNKPGANPYIGDLREAVLNQKDIPVEILHRLAHRVDRKEYDEIVSIRRDSITSDSTNQKGVHKYSPHIWNMNFGSRGRVCTTVDRSKWNADSQEKAMVFCEGQYCILLPEVCRNISRVTRLSEELTNAHTIFPAIEEQGLPSFEAMAALDAVPHAPPGEDPGQAFSSVAVVSLTDHTSFFGGENTTPPGVPVSPVPEPSTWAMMIAGLGVLYLAKKRN